MSVLEPIKCVHIDIVSSGILPFTRLLGLQVAVSDELEPGVVGSCKSNLII